jgi:hypothetical protein
VAGGGYVARHYLIECIAVATCIYSLVLLRGGLRSGSPGSDDCGATFIVLPLPAPYRAADVGCMADSGGLVSIYHIVGARPRCHGYCRVPTTCAG